MNSKQLMQRARQHIRRKEYAQARQLLVQVDHPTARAWEARLDQIAPRRRRHWWAVVLAVLLLAGGVVAWQVTATQQNTQQGASMQQTLTACVLDGGEAGMCRATIEAQ